MSEFVKTFAANLVDIIFERGEQPTAHKFNIAFRSYYDGLNTTCKIVGPALNDNPLMNTKGVVISSRTHGNFSPEEKTNFLDNAEPTSLASFNLARIIGPHAALNPVYLPGSIHLSSTQGVGWLLTSEKVQQLPFPPYSAIEAYTYDEDSVDDYICNYNPVFNGGTYLWIAKDTKDKAISAISSGGNASKIYYHIDEKGILYTNRPVQVGTAIKYNLTVPNTYGPINSGYNTIPDLSLFSLDPEDRRILTDNSEYGAVKLSYVSSTPLVSRWKIEMPRVISIKDSLVSGDKGISRYSFEPVGKVGSTETNIKYYTLPQNYVVETAPYVLSENSLALLNYSTGKVYTTYIKSWEKQALDGKDVIYFNGIKLLETELFNDNGDLLKDNPETTNTTDFVLLAFGSNLSENTAQNTLNFARHRHDGLDSYKISHKDLLDAEGLQQGDITATNNLNFVTINRQLAFSNAKDNVHPQYLHRLGYRYGGTSGRHALGNEKILDHNMLYGDLVLAPLNILGSGEYDYLYGTTSAGPAAGSEVIDWTLTTSDTESDYQANIHNKRGHALLFGYPYIDVQNSWGYGATKVYFEPFAFGTDKGSVDLYDKQGVRYSLKRHGFVPGNISNRTEEMGNHRKGMNIASGNLFFGYREDLFNGLLTKEDYTESSAYFRASEFNVVVTANGKSDQNTNSITKENFYHKDGFAVRALQGSSIWLSAGGEGSGATTSDSTNEDLKPSIIAIEASYPSEATNSPYYGLKSSNTLDPYGQKYVDGSGIFMTPGPLRDGDGNLKTPWSHGYSSNRFAGLWNDRERYDFTNNLPVGSILDIFSLAPDRNKVQGSETKIPYASDVDLTSFVYGRPFIRGTYGINFCVSSSLLELKTDFKTGWANANAGTWDNSGNWGPQKNVLKVEGNDQYIHREFRFWGTNFDIVQAADSAIFNASINKIGNSLGGNINMLYGFRKNYIKFGKSKGWDSSRSLEGFVSDDTTLQSSPWMSSRSMSLGSSVAENYGSAIRNASYIDAFQGIRHDPMHPYVAEYVIPFSAKWNGVTSPKNPTVYYRLSDFIASFDLETSNITYASNGNDLTKALCEKNILILPEHSDYSSVISSDLYEDLQETSVIFQLENVNFNTAAGSPHVDGIIRGSEDNFLKNSNQHYSDSFPRSLVSFETKLDYFTGRLIWLYKNEETSHITNINTDEADTAAWIETDSPNDNTPHSGYQGLNPDADKKSYGRVIGGFTVMVPASGKDQSNLPGTPVIEAKYNSAKENTARIPVVSLNRPPQPYMTYYNGDNVNLIIKPSTTIGYQDFLGSLHLQSNFNDGTGAFFTGYKDRFPVYNKVYLNKKFHKSDFYFDLDRGPSASNLVNNFFTPVINIPDFYANRFAADWDNRYNYNFSVPYRVYVCDENGKPVFRRPGGVAATWVYAEWFSAPAGSRDADYTANVAGNPFVRAELRGKFVIKVITSPTPNKNVDGTLA
jgi:hypothetical protein